MLRRNFFIAAAIVASALLAAAQTDSPKLDVEVTYTGAGTVDDSHKVYVIIWDTPDFVKGADSGAVPIGVKTVASKSEVAHFEDLKGTVYVSMIYDPSGKWDAASVPPSGSSIGLYSTEPGTPAPIKLEVGKTTKVSATFDDSIKMP